MLPVSLLQGVPLLRKVLRTALTHEGYAVRDDLTAPAALVWLRATPDPAHVLFGDYIPGMTVEDLLTRLRQEPALFQRHGFVFLSTQATALPAAQAFLTRSLGLPVLAVPWKHDDLLATLQATEQRLSPP
jgi:CheY-like chemotaxis protein